MEARAKPRLRAYSCNYRRFEGNHTEKNEMTLHLLPIKEPPLPDTLDCDAAPYPSEARLEQIRTADSAETGAHWMVHTFPKLCEELKPYAVCEVAVKGSEYRVRFSTSGWSGCEDFIAAVLGNTWINMMYYQSWRRGGHYEFRVTI